MNFLRLPELPGEVSVSDIKALSRKFAPPETVRMTTPARAVVLPLPGALPLQRGQWVVNGKRATGKSTASGFRTDLSDGTSWKPDDQAPTPARGVTRAVRPGGLEREQNAALAQERRTHECDIRRATGREQCRKRDTSKELGAARTDATGQASMSGDGLRPGHSIPRSQVGALESHCGHE